MIAKLIRSNIMLSLVTMLASLSGFALSLGLPLAMSPSDYTYFATLWALGQLVASLSFEWMRFGVLRFGAGADAQIVARSRRALFLCYISLTIILLAIGATSVAASFMGAKYGIYLALVVTFAAANGGFDGYQAVLRAEARNASFTLSRIMRTLLSFIGAMGGALIWGSVEAVLLGLTLSFPLSLLMTGALRDLREVSLISPFKNFVFLAQSLRKVFFFGLFAAMTTNLAMLLPVLYRFAAVRSLNPIDAAGMVLAFDLTQKAIAIVGLSVNVVVMQSSIRVAEFNSMPHVQAVQAGRQFALTLAVVAPATVGFYIIGGALAELAVTAELRESFLTVLLPATITAGILAFRMFSIDALFIVCRQTERGMLGAGITALGIALLLILPALSLETISWTITAAMLIGAASSFVLLVRGKEIAWPVADLIKIAAGCAAMVFAASLLPSLTPGADFAVRFLLCAVTYSSIILTTNAGGLRELLYPTKRN